MVLADGFGVDCSGQCSDVDAFKVVSLKPGTDILPAVDESVAKARELPKRALVKG